MSAPEALLELVQTKAAEVEYWRQLVAELEVEERAGMLLARHEEGFGAQGPVDVDTHTAGSHVYLTLLHKAQDQLAAYSVAAIRAGADKAMVEALTMQAAYLLPLLYRVISMARASSDAPDLIVRAVIDS